MRILLSGGGTGGSVSPLLAIAEELKCLVKGPDLPEKMDFLWLGSKNGIEKKMVEMANIEFRPIFSGKLRRYFSWKNFVDPIFIIIGFFQSLWINLVFKPDIILTAGSFTAVPVVWAGWVLKVPILVHQQDVKMGLANKLMLPFASIITVSLKDSAKDFTKNKNVFFTGNGIRKRIFNGSKDAAFKKFNLENNIPTLLILGGGTGALSVNTIIVQSISELTKFCNVIHITGDKIVLPLQKEEINRYHSYSFLNNIEEAYAAADLVISRAGMGVLSELAILEKPTIIIPIPDSHQEANAKYFAKRNAAVVLDQKELVPEKLTETIKNLLADKPVLNKLSENISKIMPRDGAKRIAKIILWTSHYENAFRNGKN